MTERIGDYRIEREIGAGGMGTVYAARGPDDTLVALKVVHPHLLTKVAFRERFLRELEVGRRIAHPNVVRTIDGGEDDGRPFVVLEFVEGQTLEELRDELRQVPEDLCRHIGREVAAGLAAVHAAGIVHRDVKPANVLITPEQTVKLMDLGLARSAAGDDRLSRTGMFVGTAGYAPPEQFRGTLEVDPRGDLYSLGAVLYELSTGAPPFRGRSLEEVMHKVLERRPKRPGQLNPQLSPFFEELVLVLLAKEPAARLPSAERLAEVLERGEDTDWWSQQATLVREETHRPLRRIRVPRETPCVGREGELAELREALDAARGGDGRVVLLEGEAGIGKSRLVDELLAWVEQEGLDVNVLVGSYPPGGAASGAGAFVEAFGERIEPGEGRRYLSDVPSLAPAFVAFLRGEPAPAGAAQLDTAGLRTAFVHATRSLAGERPTIVIIDDLHFSPEEGRALFAALAAAVPGRRVLLVGTARPGLPSDWRAEMERLEHVRHSRVERLSPEDVERILEPLLGQDVPARRLASSIAEKADGNPYFLVEMVRALRESGVVTQAEDGSWAVTAEPDDVPIPSTVRSLVRARLERLGEEEREILECAACRGHEFDGRLVAEALGLRRIPALRALGRIEREHGLVHAAGERFVFDHHAVVETLRHDLADSLGQELHAALAETLEERHGAAEADVADLDGRLATELCRHWLDAARGERALRYLHAALDDLDARYEHEEGAQLCHRALQVDGLLTGGERVRVLRRLYLRLDTLGRRDEQLAACREAVALAETLEEPERLALALCDLGWALRRRREFEEATEALERALATADAAGDELHAIHASNHLGLAAHDVGDTQEAARILESALARAEDLGDVGWQANIAGNLGLVYLRLGRTEDAVRHHERQREISLQQGDLHHASIATGNVGAALRRAGRLDEAREAIERALALARRVGHREQEARTLTTLATIVRTMGDPVEARELRSDALRLAREAALPGLEATLMLNVAAATLDEGRLGDAVEQSRAHIRLARRIRDVNGELVSLGNVGFQSHFLGRLDESSRANLEMLQRAREHGFRRLEATALLQEGGTHLEGGDHDAAREHWARALAIFRDCKVELSVSISLIRLAEDALRHGQPARALAEEAFEISERTGMPAALLYSAAIIAALPDATPEERERAARRYEEHGTSASVVIREQIALLMWKTTADVAYLADAQEILDVLLSHASPEDRERMLKNVTIHRETDAAWRAHGGEGATRVAPHEPPSDVDDGSGADSGEAG